MTAAFGAEHGPVVARLVDALRASPAWDPALSFVAESTPADGGPGQLTGYVLLTRNLLDAPRRLVDVLVLSPLAVRPGHQGRGVGSRLVRHALAAAGARPEPLVFLEGSPDFYPRFGFAPGRDRGFRRPSLRIPAGLHGPAAARLRALDDRHPGLRRPVLASGLRRPARPRCPRDASGRLTQALRTVQL